MSSNHVNQQKLEDIFEVIWGGTKYYHWQLVANMLYAYVLLFKGADDNKFMQCLCLYQIASIHAKPVVGELELAA